MTFDHSDCNCTSTRYIVLLIGPSKSGCGLYYALVPSVNLIFDSLVYVWPTSVTSCDWLKRNWRNTLYIKRRIANLQLALLRTSSLAVAWRTLFFTVTLVITALSSGYRWVLMMRDKPSAEISDLAIFYFEIIVQKHYFPNLEISEDLIS